MGLVVRYDDTERSGKTTRKEGKIKRTQDDSETQGSWGKNGTRDPENRRKEWDKVERGKRSVIVTKSCTRPFGLSGPKFGSEMVRDEYTGTCTINWKKSESKR